MKNEVTVNASTIHLKHSENIKIGVIETQPSGQQSSSEESPESLLSRFISAPITHKILILLFVGAGAAYLYLSNS